MVMCGVRKIGTKYSRYFNVSTLLHLLVVYRPFQPVMGVIKDTLFFRYFSAIYSSYRNKWEIQVAILCSGTFNHIVIPPIRNDGLC